MSEFKSGFLQSIVDEIPYTVAAFSSQVALYEASRVRAWELQGDTWRTVNKSSNQALVGDMGSAKAVNAVAIFNTNAPQLRIQFHSSTDFSSPAKDSGLLDLVENPLTGRYSLLYDAQSLSVNHRYFRILIPGGQTMFDGADYVEIGGICVTDSLEDILFDPSSPLNFGYIQAEEILTMLGGRSEEWDLSDGVKLWTFSMSGVIARDEPEVNQLFERIFRIGQSRPVIFGFSEILYEAQGNHMVAPFKRRGFPNYGIQDFARAVADGMNFTEAY